MLTFNTDSIVYKFLNCRHWLVAQDLSYCVIPEFNKSKLTHWIYFFLGFHKIFLEFYLYFFPTRFQLTKYDNSDHYLYQEFEPMSFYFLKLFLSHPYRLFHGAYKHMSHFKTAPSMNETNNFPRICFQPSIY